MERRLGDEGEMSSKRRNAEMPKPRKPKAEIGAVEALNR